MQTLNRFGLILGAMALTSACSSASDSGESTATEEDIAVYQQLTFDIEDHAQTYGVTMHDTALADCLQVHDRYDAQVRPWVAQIGDLSESMDRYMSDHGGTESLDYQCVSGAMMDELDHHHALACTSSDTDDNQAEVSRHVDAMTSYAEHLWDRCDEMMQGAETGTWNWGPMMSTCSGIDSEMPMHDSEDMMHGDAQSPGSMMNH